MVSMDISAAARLIGLIDSGEESVFLEHYAQEGAVVRLYGEDRLYGVFAAYYAYGKPRVQIAFEEDASEAECGQILSFIAEAKRRYPEPAALWARPENARLLREIGKIYPFPARPYQSIEYIMRRECFSPVASSSDIIPQMYCERDLDECLALLDRSMTFADPPPAYAQSRERYAQRFLEYAALNSMELFRITGALAGLYWRDGREIDTLAVHSDFQRQGIGSMILSRAIQSALDNTDAPFARLYCVDWNDKGQAFYKKFGMESNAHSFGINL